jgi:large subunit ribosomal protein L4
MADAPVLPLTETGGGAAIALDAGAFEARFHGPLVHHVVVAELAARRQGTAATKTRGMVSGGSSKPWRQKGTGRARAGSSRSPLWTGGGIVFGPQPRKYIKKVNRKERRAALRSALSLHASRGSLAIFDAGAFGAPRTRQAAELLTGWGQPRPTLVVVGPEEHDAALSFRNLAGVLVLDHQEVGVADVVRGASLLCSHEGLQALSARAAGAVTRGVGSSDGAVAEEPGGRAPIPEAEAAQPEPEVEAAQPEAEVEE